MNHLEDLTNNCKQDQLASHPREEWYSVSVMLQASRFMLQKLELSTGIDKQPGSFSQLDWTMVYMHL